MCCNRKGRGDFGEGLISRGSPRVTAPTFYPRFRTLARHRDRPICSAVKIKGKRNCQPMGRGDFVDGIGSRGLPYTAPTFYLRFRIVAPRRDRPVCSAVKTEQNRIVNQAEGGISRMASFLGVSRAHVLPAFLDSWRGIGIDRCAAPSKSFVQPKLKGGFRVWHRI